MYGFENYYILNYCSTGNYNVSFVATWSETTSGIHNEANVCRLVTNVLNIKLVL